MPCQGQVRHACVHRRATSRVKAKKKKAQKGGKEKRKELAEEGKKRRSDAGSELGREHRLGGETPAILEGGHRDIILDYLYQPR